MFVFVVEGRKDNRILIISPSHFCSLHISTTAPILESGIKNVNIYLTAPAGEEGAEGNMMN